MKTIAVVPVYNEEQYISDVVFVLNELVGMVIVVDDRSSDGTVKEATDAGAYVVRRFGKRGVGANTKSGIDEALIRECDVIVTLDGDGQHNPSEVFRVIEPIEKGDADVVVGSRFLSGDNGLIPTYRKFGINVITWLYNFGNKNRLSDVQCCFRAFKREVLLAIAIEEKGFAFSTEILVKARALGFRISEVPVSVLYHRQFSQNSSLNPILHGFSVAFLTIKVRFKIELLPRIKNWLKKD